VGSRMTDAIVSGCITCHDQWRMLHPRACPPRSGNTPLRKLCTMIALRALLSCVTWGSKHSDAFAISGQPYRVLE
jgi:hypothetical protein